MFFGNMQSYYRRNSIRNQSSSHESQSKASKEMKRVKHLKKNEAGDNEENCKVVPLRRKSFSISRDPENEDPIKDFKSVNIPTIKIGQYGAECTEKSLTLCTEKVTGCKSCRDPDDNSERLGPNKNNIIEETLRLERSKSSEWTQQSYD